VKIIRSTDKGDVIDEIEQGFDDGVVYLSIRPSIDVVVALLENDPTIEIILCPPSLYDLTSERVKHALKKVGISLEKGSFTVGRPRKYTKREIEEMVGLYNAGMPVVTIAEELGIPRRTIYYYINKVENDEI
jgi:hypothetical protein